MKKTRKLWKSKKILIFSFALILFGGGLFFWFKDSKEIKGSPEDYEIIATEKGVFVENQKAGLVVKVPQGWEVEKMEEGEGFLIMHPSEIWINREDEKVKLPLEEGCIIDASVVYEKMDFAEIKLDIKYTFLNLDIVFQDLEEIALNDFSALKNIFETKKTGPGIGINIPKEDKVYTFYLYWAQDQKEECIQEFDNFLEEILINQ